VVFEVVFAMETAFAELALVFPLGGVDQQVAH
jgi:hypothetical protein